MPQVYWRIMPANKRIHSGIYFCLCTQMANMISAKISISESLILKEQRFWNILLAGLEVRKMDFNKLKIDLQVADKYMSDSLQPYGLKPVMLLYPWKSPSKNSGGGCQFLLQGIFPTQGSNPCLLHLLQRQVASLPVHHLENKSHKVERGERTLT